MPFKCGDGRCLLRSVSASKSSREPATKRIDLGREQADLPEMSGVINPTRKLIYMLRISLYQVYLSLCGNMQRMLLPYELCI